MGSKHYITSGEQRLVYVIFGRMGRTTISYNTETRVSFEEAVDSSRDKLLEFLI